MKISLESFGTRIGPVKFFVVMATVFGMAFLLITPPFQGADEIVHFYRAYQVSEGHFIADRTSKSIGGELPVSLGKVVSETNPNAIAFYPQNKYDVYRTEHALSIKNSLGEKKFYDFSTSAPYSPVSYIGPSSGITVARSLRLPTIVSFYAGRMGNLVAWIALVGAAIFYLPRRKWALVAVGLLPMALFQAATLNGDVTTTGSLALFLALILHYREKNKPLSIRELIALLLVSIVMALSKEIMFVFLPLVLLLKKGSFGSRRREYFIKLALIIIPLLSYVGWLIVNKGISGVNAYSNHQNPGAQLLFILHSPESYINVLWNTYFYTWGDSITRSFVGTFGWSDAPLSELIVTVGYMGLAILFVATYTNKTKEFFQKKEKYLLWLVLLLYWAAASTALYLYYSPVGYKIIYGLQGRYFLPLAVVALPLLQSKSVRVDKKLYKRIAVWLPIVLLISSTITIYVRYFVNNV